MENPISAFHNFLVKWDTIKLNGASADAIRLRLFPFLLKDRASDWLFNEEPNSFTTLVTAKLRAKITSFAQ